MKAFLADAKPARGAPPVALVVPHAGYRYSGQIAADGWAQARGQDYDLVVLLGTNHTTAGFTGASVYTGAGLRTPLGVARVDTKAAAALLAAGGDFNADPRVHEREHSIEVQVPFAQVLFPGVAILPVVVGSEDARVCARIGRTLAHALAGRRPLVVASSDLSHYPDDAGSRASDHAVLAAIARLDPAGLQATMETQMNAGHRGLETCACGAGAVMAAMEAARALGAVRGTVVSWANSGEVPPNDRTRVVGYGAVLVRRGRTPPGRVRRLPGAEGRPAAGPRGRDAPLDAAAKRALLRLARETLERWFATGGTVPLPRDLPAATRRPQGAFVTLYRGRRAARLHRPHDAGPAAGRHGRRPWRWPRRSRTRASPPVVEGELKDDRDRDLGAHAARAGRRPRGHRRRPRRRADPQGRAHGRLPAPGRARAGLGPRPRCSRTSAARRACPPTPGRAAPASGPSRASTSASRSTR